MRVVHVGVAVERADEHVEARVLCLKEGEGERERRCVETKKGGRHCALMPHPGPLGQNKASTHTRRTGLVARRLLRCARQTGHSLTSAGLCVLCVVGVARVWRAAQEVNKQTRGGCALVAVQHNKKQTRPAQQVLAAAALSPRCSLTHPGTLARRCCSMQRAQ